MEYKDIYSAFLQMGGGTNLDFNKFIPIMKKHYFSCYSFSNEDTILNQDNFIRFVYSFVDGWLAGGCDIKDFLREYKT